MFGSTFHYGLIKLTLLLLRVWLRFRNPIVRVIFRPTFTSPFVVSATVVVQKVIFVATLKLLKRQRGVTLSPDQSSISIRTSVGPNLVSWLILSLPNQYSPVTWPGRGTRVSEPLFTDKNRTLKKKNPSWLCYLESHRNLCHFQKRCCQTLDDNRPSVDRSQCCRPSCSESGPNLETDQGRVVRSLSVKCSG